MRIRLGAASLLGVAVLTAACSSGGAASPAATTAPATVAPTVAPTEAPSVPASEAPPATGAASLALADNALGKILVDDKGMTLYVFLPDKAGASTCYDACATAWPPVTSDAAPTLGTGLDAEDFATTDRTDGSKQVTFYGWPLYHFGGDKAAGDANGQGLKDVWYVVGADGAAIGAPAASAATGGGVEVKTATTSLGDILVDGNGMTLYMFTADADGKSACNGDCAGAWPPLLADATPTLGEGLAAADFASITRDDGGKQVTFHGMPLYFFSGDKAAGDTNGQGLNSKWYVLKADGTVVK